MSLTNWLPGPIAGLVRQPRPGPTGMDLDSGVDFPRFVTPPGPTPSRPVIGGISALLPLQNAFSVQAAIGKRPTGPGIGTPIPNAGQVVFPPNIFGGVK